MTRRAVIKVGAGDPTLRGRWLGARLREYREAAGLTGEQVAEEIGRAAGTLSQWENGRFMPRVPDVQYMLDLYTVPNDQREPLLRAAREARKPGAQVVSAAVADHAWLESRAWKIETYQDITLPGLLQTPAYAHEIIKAWDPDATAERIERAVAARMARQTRLTDDDLLQLSVMLDEGVLRRPIGGPDVMRAQLRHLVDQAAQPNVEIRVVPYAVGAHAGLPGPFTILRFREDPDLSYLETRGGDIYLDDPAPFAQALRRLAKIALPPRKSVAKIAAMRREIT